MELHALDRQRAVPQAHDEARAVGEPGRHLERRVRTPARRPPARGSGRPRTATAGPPARRGRRARSARRGRGRRSRSAPPATPCATAMHWWPRQMPSTGIRAPNTRIAAVEMPASSGPCGPGETMIPAGSAVGDLVEARRVATARRRCRRRSPTAGAGRSARTSRGCRGSRSQRPPGRRQLVDQRVTAGAAGRPTSASGTIPRPAVVRNAPSRGAQLGERQRALDSAGPLERQRPRDARQEARHRRRHDASRRGSRTRSRGSSRRPGRRPTRAAPRRPPPSRRPRPRRARRACARASGRPGRSASTSTPDTAVGGRRLARSRRDRAVGDVDRARPTGSDAAAAQARHQLARPACGTSDSGTPVAAQARRGGARAAARGRPRSACVSKTAPVTSPPTVALAACRNGRALTIVSSASSAASDSSVTAPPAPYRRTAVAGRSRCGSRSTRSGAARPAPTQNTEPQ